MRTLAARLHISRAGVYARVERLQRAGVIVGYSAVIDPERCGYGISAYVHIKISQHSWKSVREMGSKMKGALCRPKGRRNSFGCCPPRD